MTKKEEFNQLWKATWNYFNIGRQMYILYSQTIFIKPTLTNRQIHFIQFVSEPFVNSTIINTRVFESEITDGYTEEPSTHNVNQRVSSIRDDLVSLYTFNQNMSWWSTGIPAKVFGCISVIIWIWTSDLHLFTHCSLINIVRLHRHTTEN